MHDSVDGGVGSGFHLFDYFLFKKRTQKYIRKLSLNNICTKKTPRFHIGLHWIKDYRYLVFYLKDFC
jgi:hypothetical protein